MEFISLTYKFGTKLGLTRISTLLNYLGNPHKKLKFVHVAGTNGKGSTTAFISSILKEAGYNVGIFTSPYIHRFSERIKVGQDEITKQDIGRIIEVIKSKVELMKENDEGTPTEFEIVTTMAMVYYAEKHCDIVVLEVGLGGRLDSTNIIDKPEVVVITTIDYDHMDLLGSTLQEIAGEKAGIIKNDCDVVLYPTSSEVLQVIKEKCFETNSNLYEVNLNDISTNSAGLKGVEFNYKQYKNLRIALIPDFQAENAAVAVSAVELLNKRGFIITEKHIRIGLLNARWPGRFEVLHQNPTFLVDGAHNIQGVKALVRNLKKHFGNKNITFIIGVMGDKDYVSMIECIAPIASRIIAVTPDYYRALDAADLAVYLEKYSRNVIVAGKVRNGIEKALQICEKEEVVCSFGSLYYISEVREYFGKD